MLLAWSIVQVAQRPHRAVSLEWRDKKWGFWSSGKSTCAKCCPKHADALHRLLAETRIGRDDVPHATSITLSTQCTDIHDTSETDDEFAPEMSELEDIYAVDLVDEGQHQVRSHLVQEGPKDCGRENGFRSPALLDVTAPR